ncbi:MAG: hypothetical protein QM731_09495 [Chitinophagaceae bacterium]
MKQTKLLPGHFKLVGLIVALLAFLGPIIYGMLQPQPYEATAVSREVARTVVLLGMFLIIASREKEEDEFIDSCRLRAAIVAFVFGIVIYIVNTFMQFKDVQNIFSAFRVLFSQSLFYLIAFNLYKRGNLVKQ